MPDVTTDIAGGINMPQGRLFRRQIRRPFGLLRVGPEKIQIQNGITGRDAVVIHPADAEYTVQRLLATDWVGLRSAASEWIWFSPSANASGLVAARLDDVGITRIKYSAFGLMTLFPILPLGALAFVAFGVAALVSAWVLGLPATNQLGFALPVVGIMAAAAGVAMLLMHLFHRIATSHRQ